MDAAAELAEREGAALHVGRVAHPASMEAWTYAEVSHRLIHDATFPVRVVR